MRCLPVADDCGVNRETSQAILRCLDSGALRGTSLLANGEDAAEAAAALVARHRNGTGLEIGVHLNLLEGNAVAPAAELPLLVDAQGRFRHTLFSLWALLTRSSRATKAQALAQVGVEFSAQIERVQALLAAGESQNKAPGENPASGAGVPLYVDGHLHVHTLPALVPVLDSLLARYPVTRVRVPAEARYYVPAGPALQLVGTVRRELLSYWSGPLRTLLRRRGVAASAFFIGAFCSGQMTLPRLRAGLEQVRRLDASGQGLVEIMFHPGADLHPGGTGGSTSKYHAFYASPARQAEREMLLSMEFQDLMRQYDPEWPVTRHTGREGGV